MKKVLRKFKTPTWIMNLLSRKGSKVVNKDNYQDYLDNITNPDYPVEVIFGGESISKGKKTTKED